MSYVERTLYWFLKNKVFGGIKKLRAKEYLPVTILVLGFAAISTAATILLQFDLIFSLPLNCSYALFAVPLEREPSHLRGQTQKAL